MFVFGVSLFFSALLLLNSGTDARFVGRVIGGRDAEDAEYPYQVSLRVSGIHKCGGSLLNKRWILTAAHCLVKFKPSQITLVLGTNSLMSGGVAYFTEQVRVHPDYVSGGRENDIGLIRVTKDIEYGEAIQPIALPTSDVNEDDCIATFTGWGSTAIDGTNHLDLQVIELNVIHTSSCHSIFSTVGRSHLCTFTVAGEGVCYGDSGGPLVADGMQIAIASWGSPCARGYPDVHTRVYKYAEWIKAIIE